MNYVLQYLREVSYLLGKDRRHLPWLLVIFFSTSLLDLVGLGLIAPYITLMVNPELAMTGTIGQLSAQFGVEYGSKQLLIFMSGILLAVFAIKAVVAIWINRTIIAFGLRKHVQLSSFLMRAYQQLPYTEYLRRNSSEYIYSIQVLSAQFSGKVLQTLLHSTSNSIVCLVIMMMLAWSSFTTFMVLFMLLSSLVLGYDRLFRKNLHRYGQLVNQFSTTMVQAIHEGIEGLKEIRILGRGAHFHKLVRDKAKKASDIILKEQVISSAPRYLLEFMMVAFLVLMVLNTLALGQDLKALLPTLGMFVVAGLRLVPTVNAISSSLLQLRFSRDGVSRLYKELHQLEQQERVTEVFSSGTPELFRILTLKDVVFAYPQATQPALCGVSLQLTAGESIGLIGPSGAGKTTLVDVLLGLLEPQAGELRYNEYTLKEALPEWRSQIAYLPQQVFLIDNTLRRNVALGEEDSNIDEVRLQQALNQACLSELVEQLSQGVDTMVGERGVRLSGGQRQRVALARAFYHQRSILVMDEATSALDNETERVIIDEIQRLKGQKTMIVIAHRLTTVQNCDNIYRLVEGRIVEQGPPNYVLRKAG